MQEANIDPNDISAVTGFLQNYYKNTLLPQITLNNNSSPKKSAWSDKVLSLLQQSFQAVNDKKGADAVNTIDQAVVAVNKWEKMEPPSFESEQPLVIGSGTVTSMTGVEDYLGVQHSFAHRYEGSEAPNSHWVQFVWITVERKEPSSPPELLSGSTSGNIGEVPFTTDVNQKKICIDALNKNTEPYYEQFGTHIKTATLLEMQDKPTALSTFKDDDAYQCMVGKPIGTKITQALHFDSFLVQNAQTVAHAEVTVTNQWEHVQCGPVMTTKQQNIKDQKQIGNVQAVNAMPAEYKSVMLTRFSGFSNIN